ncbi:MAG: hypothetical protein CBD16_02520 [Betaproteobacteria bacterium TMED156]|nr:MAG: hypothetical protein CBD16_02520 [Betaproteobacteria bacterium TMED156]
MNKGQVDLDLIMKKNYLKEFLLKISILIFLAGCSPTFDWRVYHHKNNYWQALFPSKPTVNNREFKLKIEKDFVKLKMEQYISSVKDINFIVDNSEFIHEKIDIKILEKKLKTSLEKNFKLKNKRNLENQIVSYSGSFLSKNNITKKIKLLTLITLRDNVVVRGVVFSDYKKFSEDEAIFFLRSIKLKP